MLYGFPRVRELVDRNRGVKSRDAAVDMSSGFLKLDGLGRVDLGVLLLFWRSRGGGRPASSAPRPRLVLPLGLLDRELEAKDGVLLFYLACGQSLNCFFDQHACAYRYWGALAFSSGCRAWYRRRRDGRARRSIHTAFDNPMATPDAPPRESIESRLLEYELYYGSGSA